MSKRRLPLVLENLESRLNLSALAPVLPPSPPNTPVAAQFIEASLLQRQHSRTPLRQHLSAELFAATRPHRLFTINLAGQAGTSGGGTLPGDANGDSQVNFIDFTILSRNFGSITTAGPAAADFNSDGQVDFSDFTILSRHFGQALAPSPSNLQLQSTSSSTVHLSWTDTSALETGIRIYRSTDNFNFTLVSTLPASATAFDDSALAANTTYFYQAAATSSGGESVSGSAAITTPAPGGLVSIYSKNMTSFSELNIDGTAGNDSILVTQSGGMLNITANGQTTSLPNTFGDLVIHGFAGNDSITVDSSVNIATLIYGGDGNDTIVNQTSGKATIVAINSFTNTVTGNGVNTSYWVNPNDIVNASATEIAALAVNRVANFYQPSSGAVPRTLYGQNLPDPTDSGTVHRLTANSFWGTAPIMNDVNQGTIGDCYYLAPLASLANNNSLKFMNTGVDLGDGTFAIRFIRNGITSFVRVDGDLSDNYFAHPGAAGNMWAAIYEKAYAFFRTGANTYASLNSGSQAAALSDLGFRNAGIAPSAGDSAILTAVNNALNTGNAAVASTFSSVTPGAPLIGYHAYSVIGAYRDTFGTVMLQLRNPWGYDGAGTDSNPADGLVTIAYSTFSANFSVLTYTLS